MNVRLIEKIAKALCLQANKQRDIWQTQAKIRRKHWVNMAIVAIQIIAPMELIPGGKTFRGLNLPPQDIDDFLALAQDQNPDP